MGCTHSVRQEDQMDGLGLEVLMVEPGVAKIEELREPGADQKWRVKGGPRSRALLDVFQDSKREWGA